MGASCGFPVCSAGDVECNKRDGDVGEGEDGHDEVGLSGVDRRNYDELDEWFRALFRRPVTEVRSVTTRNLVYESLCYVYSSGQQT